MLDSCNPISLIIFSEMGGTTLFFLNWSSVGVGVVVAFVDVSVLNGIVYMCLGGACACLFALQVVYKSAGRNKENQLEPIFLRQ